MTRSKWLAVSAGTIMLALVYSSWSEIERYRRIRKM
jgi:hypothetical protein